MKNVLVIVYYFPPMGGSGVQRPLKFIKYLRDFGWNPIVICPEPGTYQVFDSSLQMELEKLNVEIHRVMASTPFHLLRRKGGENKVTISDEKARILRKISKLLFYPDNKKAWIKPAVSKALELIKSKKIDLIFSTAPPFSNHLAALRIKKESRIPLVLDYRDSWLNNHFMTDLFSWQRAIMSKMEKSCLVEADAVIGLDEFMADGITENHPELNLNIEIIPHGYDPEDFDQEVGTTFSYKSEKLNFLYSGLFYESNQPDIFLKAIKSLIKDSPELINKIHFHFQGGLDKRIKKLISDLELDTIVSDYGYVPHSEAVINLKKADLLWMISNFSKELKQIKSGKLFEYIGSQKPIIGLVHDGKALNLLNNYEAGFTASPQSIEEIKSVLNECIIQWKSGNLPKPNKEFIGKFNRKKLSKELASIFNVISS